VKTQAIIFQVVKPFLAENPGYTVL